MKLSKMLVLKGLIVLAVSLALVEGAAVTKSKKKTETAEQKPNDLPTEVKTNTTTPCICGVFLTGQFVKGSDEQPKGDPVVIHDTNQAFPSNPHGQKLCQTQCSNAFADLPTSADTFCATVGRDLQNEQAYLFTKNWEDSWVISNLSIGKEYCCKDGQSYQCPQAC